MSMPKLTDDQLLHSMFIDPWKREITLVKIEKDLKQWYKALECDCLDMGRFVKLLPSGNAIDVWVDDIGQLRKPGLATFSMRGRVFHGYGLVFEGQDPDTVSVGFDFQFVHDILCLTFEEWEKRLDPKHYLEQMTRVIEWEDWYHEP